MADGLQITIQPLPGVRPDGPDQWHRLRRFLKVLLRAHGWKAVRIEFVGDEVDDAEEGAT